MSPSLLQRDTPPLSPFAVSLSPPSILDRLNTPKSPTHSSRAQPTAPLAASGPPSTSLPPILASFQRPYVANWRSNLCDALCGDTLSCVQLLRGCLLIQGPPHRQAKGWPAPCVARSRLILNHLPPFQIHSLSSPCTWNCCQHT